jgi:hypothetical protein
MRQVMEYGTKLPNGTRYGINDSWSEKASLPRYPMDCLAEAVSEMVIDPPDRDGIRTGLATTLAMRAVVALGTAERDSWDSDIPCESWKFAANAHLTPREVLAYGGWCATPGCDAAPEVVVRTVTRNRHNQTVDRSHLVCDGCRKALVNNYAITTTIVRTLGPDGWPEGFAH